MKWLCKLIGRHGVKHIRTRSAISILGSDLFYWPATISYCPRCGLVYESVDAPTEMPQITMKWTAKP